ncbi:MAG: DUF1460 domain-containing protein [Pseudarcicella sp.]|nr:DUF1460 domain-containing protein [Pseudarcicella sp.]MBP6411616.1 DUF1460 domain-containing protein [Pseudarcicella sp.]
MFKFNTSQKLLSCFILLISLASFQSIESDQEIYNKKIKKAQGENIDEFTLNISKSFLNRPYKAHTLEINSEEKLVINLREFDCATFVESCIAMGISYRKNQLSFEKMKVFLQKLRYHDNKIKGYESRIHYFSDWIRTHTEDGLLQDVTLSIGGQEYKKNIHYMSSHWRDYPQAKSQNTQNIIKQREEYLNSQTMSYIPKSKIKNIENKIHNGDIIAITSNIDGLDISHQGFAIKMNKRIYLLHASSEHKRVMVTEKPLAEYLASKPAQTGIMVVRLL